MERNDRILIEQQKEELIQKIKLYRIWACLKDSKIFTQNMLDDITDMSILLEELPTRGPQALEKFIQVCRDSGYDINCKLQVCENSKINEPD